MSRLLLVSENYPPAIGGSAVLFGEIYPRLGVPFTVLSEGVKMPDYGRRSLWRYLRLTLRLRQAARDVTMVHCGRALPEGVAAWLCRFVGGPRYAVWAHGEDIGTALTSRELTFLMRRVYAGAEVVFANSENTRRMLNDLGIDRVDVIYPGVDTERFRPDLDAADIRHQLAPHHEFVLLSVGRLQTRKGHDLMIQAVRLLAQRRSLRYVIIGTGKERARLEALVDACGVRESVTFCGDVPADLLPKYFAACDLFVLPNRNEHGDIEGFGIVFLEAAASAKATIGGNSGGVPEAVGNTGVLVSGTDATELAAAIARLMDDAALRKELGDAGRRRVESAFTWEAAARRLAATHQRLTGEPLLSRL
jgi:phosphatidyl-myo-inositol dimannoside synthase